MEQSLQKINTPAFQNVDVAKKTLLTVKTKKYAYQLHRVAKLGINAETANL
jgi:hypothetical protein